MLKVNWEHKAVVWVLGAVALVSVIAVIYGLIVLFGVGILAQTPAPQMPFTVGPVNTPRWNVGAAFEVRTIGAGESLTFRTVRDQLSGVCTLIVMSNDGGLAVTNITAAGCP